MGFIGNLGDFTTEWTQDWDSDQGFGSSDGTYMLKEFIDNVIWSFTNGGKYMTKFTPILSVVPYCEPNIMKKFKKWKVEFKP